MRQTDVSQDHVEALLRTTGRRPDVPGFRADRVEAAVRAGWRADLRRRSRRRFTWAGAAVAVAALVVLGVRFLKPAPPPSALPAAVAAHVVMVVDGGPSPSANTAAVSQLRRGDAVRIGSTVATGDHGRIALLMGSGHSLRLDTGTRVTLISDRVVALDRGAVYVDSRSPGGQAEGSVEIRTSVGTVRDLGTQFEVRAMPAVVLVRVREGKVVVQVPDTAVDVVAGQELERRSTGEMTRHTIPDGQVLAWTRSITPVLDIDGRSMREFLDWNARERGLRLEFLDPVAARAAGAITLSGSIDGMTLEEALASVLSTSRLSARVVDRILRIEASKERGSGP